MSYNVLAVDPGGTTGLAFWSSDTGHRAWMVKPMESAQNVVHAFLADTGQERLNLCVFEAYTITARTLKTGNDPGHRGKELEFIGVGRHLARCYGVDFKLQMPGDAMRFSNDEKLHRLGWWTPGPDHARAASRHLLLALVELGKIDHAKLLPQEAA